MLFAVSSVRPVTYSPRFFRQTTLTGDILASGKGDSPTNQSRKRQHPVRDEGLNSLAHKFPGVAAQWDLDQNPFPPTHVRPGSNRPIWWLCDRGHSWLATPYVRTRDHGCPVCKGKKATLDNNLASVRPDLLHTWHYQRNQIELRLAPTEVLPQSNKKVWWTCPHDPSHEYEASPASRFRGRGCPYCAGKRVSSSNSVATTSPLLAAEWDPANFKSAEQVARGSDYKAGWICSQDTDHKWTAAVSSRPDSGSGCPFCAGKRPTDRNRLDVKMPALAGQWHPSKNGDLVPAKVTTGSNKPVWWVCPKDSTHVWEAQVRARALDGDGCKWCAPVMRSKIDIALACEFAVVFPYDVDPASQERLDLGHNRPHSVDILIKSERIVIEFDGSHSHKGKGHELCDLSKTARLHRAGFRVMRIRETPLALLDPIHNVSIEQRRQPDVKLITNIVLQRMTDLGWVRGELVRSYLSARGPQGAELATAIYESIPESERFVPLSVKAKRKQDRIEAETTGMLF